MNWIKPFANALFLGCATFFLSVSLMADPTGSARPKPFELWPATNDAIPTAFTKTACQQQLLYLDCPHGELNI